MSFPTYVTVPLDRTMILASACSAGSSSVLSPVLSFVLSFVLSGASGWSSFASRSEGSCMTQQPAVFPLVDI